ncbi:aspartate/glutamate racemase family protein [Rhodospirillaceae bacterium]|nr:aspartate/glutamate racemase family protein [Alphaproteobacteria bacterium]MDC1441823.1 aspartate/glutamate racemase family protein [Rhodospirillaceae bacterium]
MPPRIALIHAIEMAIHPIAQAFQTHWPEAETINILDDSLSKDRASSDSLDRKIVNRFLTLGDYAKSIDANGILFTCSAFGPAIEAVAEQHTMPVLKPNEAMFSRALNIGKNICMLVTFENSIDSMCKEFQVMANVRNNAAKLDVVFVDGAMLKLKQGLMDDHNELILQTAKKMNGYDVLMLAQFSMASAREAISQQINIPILTAPDAATKLMKKKLTK